MGRKGLVIAVVIGCLAFPVAASAGMLTVAQDVGPTQVVTYTGDAAADLVDVDNHEQDGDEWYYVFFATPTPTSPVCNPTGPPPDPPWRCAVTQAARLVMIGNGGADQFDVSPLPAATMFFLQDGPVNADGGPGNDLLVGSPNQDTFVGGADNDEFRSFAALDRFEGGDGTDTLVVPGATGYFITLDGVGDDGTVAARTGNVLGDVEQVDGGGGGDTIAGSAAANRLRGMGGNDTIDGKGGADDLQGGDQNDTIEARDGAVDTVDCGAGTDTANVDFRDVVTNCESVSRTARDDDGDGSPNGVDCNDDNAAIKPGAGEIPNNGVDEDCSGADATVDADGDGAVPPADCDDANPRRRPGAADRPQNGVDENCDGRDAPFHRNRAVVSNSWLAFSTYTLVERLSLRNIPSGGKATIKCTGGGCPFKKAKRLKVRRGKANATRLFRDDRLSVGARIEIRITARDTIGKIVRYTIRSRKLPARRERCDPPGRPRPKRC